MRRRSLTSNLGRVALAYLLALQTLLGAWVGHATAATSNAFDPSLTLCRTAGAGETQKSDRDGIVPAHCAVMCLSAACGGSAPPALVSAEVEFLPQRVHAVSLPAAADAVGGKLLHRGLNARGPPSIA
jgi:hypothetical protein